MVTQVDPTTLWNSASLILTLLEDAAADMGWTLSRSCVTSGPKAAECDSIFVWADDITPTRDQAGSRCQIVLRSRFQYVLAACTGLDACDEVGAAQMHDIAWGVQAAFVQAVMNGAVCPAAEACATIRWGSFTLLTNDGGFSWWQGSIQIDLSPEELAS
jgi:hypothetical protein